MHWSIFQSNKLESISCVYWVKKKKYIAKVPPHWSQGVNLCLFLQENARRDRRTGRQMVPHWDVCKKVIHPCLQSVGRWDAGCLEWEEEQSHGGPREAGSCGETEHQTDTHQTRKDRVWFLAERKYSFYKQDEKLQNHQCPEQIN